MLDVQTQSTDINVRSYWPAVVASAAMLLATDAMSIERTHGAYMVSSCDIASEIVEFAQLQGSAELLLKFAMTYDFEVGKLLTHHVLETAVQRNVTELRNTLLEEGFVDVCNNMTRVERTHLTVKWADDIQTLILAIDELRESYVIPSILQVDDLAILRGNA